MPQNEIDAIRYALQIPGAKVLDTSFLHYRSKGEEDFSLEIAFLKQITAMEIPRDLLCSQETIEEFKTHIITGRRSLDEMKKTPHRMPHFQRGRPSNHTAYLDRGHGFAQFTDSIAKLNTARKNAYHHVSRSHLESRIPSNIWSHFADIENMFLTLHEEAKKTKALHRGLDRLKGLEENQHNDGIVMAKAFALSYAEPVTILTGDIDYVHMLDRLSFTNGGILGEFNLTGQGKPNIPDHNLSVIMRAGDELMLKGYGDSRWNPIYPQPQNFSIPQSQQYSLRQASSQ